MQRLCRIAVPSTRTLTRRVRATLHVVPRHTAQPGRSVFPRNIPRHPWTRYARPSPGMLGTKQRRSQELGFGNGMTCWRRLRDWQADGIWERLHLALLTRLREHDQIDWTRASIDGAAVASPRGANRQARTLRTAANSAATPRSPRLRSADTDHTHSHSLMA